MDLANFMVILKYTQEGGTEIIRECTGYPLVQDYKPTVLIADFINISGSSTPEALKEEHKEGPWEDLTCVPQEKGP